MQVKQGVNFSHGVCNGIAKPELDRLQRAQRRSSERRIKVGQTNYVVETRACSELVSSIKPVPVRFGLVGNRHSERIPISTQPVITVCFRASIARFRSVISIPRVERISTNSP